MNPHNLNEEDIKYQFITPVIEKIGWNKNQICLEYTLQIVNCFLKMMMNMTIYYIIQK